jgi:cell division protein FtsW
MAMTRETGPDWVFLFSALALIAIGIVMTLSTSSVLGFKQYQDSFLFIRKQGLFLVLGCMAMAVAIRLPVAVYRRWLVLGYWASVGVLALTLIPGLGVELGGASQWLSVAGVQFQPIELVKVFMGGVLGVMLHNKRAQMGQVTQGLLPIMLVMAVPLGLLAMQPDLGNIILISGMVFVCLVAVGVPGRQVTALAVLGVMVLGLIVAVYPYQQERIRSYLDPWADPLGKNYHAVQSMIAVGSGGLTGVGLGQSKLKYFYLPLHHSDFIFSVICEEAGFLGGVTVIGLFGVLVYRGVFIAKRVVDPVVRVWVLGLVVLLGGQAFLNIGVVIGVFPITGIPLTFISLGGSSLVTAMLSVGIVMRMSLEPVVEVGELQQ